MTAEEKPGAKGPPALPTLIDLESLAAAHRETLAALMEANRVALEAAQAVARRHMDILQAAMGDATAAMRQLGSATPADLAGRQAERVAAAQAQAMAHMRDVAAAIQATNAAALQMLGRGAPAAPPAEPKRR